MREYLRTPGHTGAAAGEPPFSRGQALPGYSPDFNGDEAIWGWAREEATGNLCLGSRTKVQERVGSFLAGLASRSGEVKRRCNRGPKRSCQIPSPIPGVRQMHIPPWPWFRLADCLDNNAAGLGQRYVSEPRRSYRV